jgi:hemerythrin superfamily protein
MTHKLEELASKAVGTIKAAKATMEGMSGVFRHLEREHGEVSTLLLRLELSADPDTRRELWQTIRKELLAHEQAEKTEVYAAFAANPETREMASEHERDAEDLQTTIEELNALATDSAVWQPTLKRLIELVQEHVRDEEEEYFPIGDRVFRDRSDDMLARFENAKARAMLQLNS